MNKYFDFMKEIINLPDFKNTFIVLLILQMISSFFSASKNLTFLGFFLSIFCFGFLITFLNNSIRGFDPIFPAFKKNIPNFLSKGFRFVIAQLVLILPIIIIGSIVVIAGIGTGMANISNMGLSFFIMFISVAVALLLFCLYFYIFPALVIRFTTTNSLAKTLNLTKLYAFWHKSKKIYDKMFKDIVIISLIFFSAGLLLLALVVLVLFSGFAGQAISMSNLFNMADFHASFAFVVVTTVILGFVAFNSLSVFSTMAIYRVMSVYYRIPRVLESVGG